MRAARFDELVVDEAQDTMDTQVRCLELLKEAGLLSLVVIGDPNQAIYGFAGAEPARLENLVAGLGLDRLELTENWRSSQRICNSAVEFCERTAADRAVGPRAGLAIEPELIVYEEGQLRHAVEIFERRLGELGLTAGKVAVLCRGRGTRDALNGTGGGVFKGRLADLAELAHAVQQHETIGAPSVQAVEAELLRYAWPEIVDEELDETRRLQLRTAVFELACRLPDTALTAKEWCKQAREATTATIASLTETPATMFKPRTPSGTGALVVADLLAGRRGALRARTIHAVKGESYDATLTVAITTDRFDNVADWLSGGEERRIAYVALTRAKSYSAVAVPDSCDPGHIAALEARGFRCLPRTPASAAGIAERSAGASRRGATWTHPPIPGGTAFPPGISARGPDGDATSPAGNGTRTTASTPPTPPAHPPPLAYARMTSGTRCSATGSSSQPLQSATAPASDSGCSAEIVDATVGSGRAAENAATAIVASSTCVVPFALALTKASQTNRPRCEAENSGHARWRWSPGQRVLIARSTQAA